MGRVNRFRGRPRGRPRQINPESGRVRIVVRNPKIWRELMALCESQRWELTWLLETAIEEKVKDIKKRMRSVELSEAHLVRHRPDRPSNTITESLRRLGGKVPEPTDVERANSKGWVQSFDDRMRAISDKLSAAGKRGSGKR